MIAYTLVEGRRTLVEVVKSNARTVLVSLIDGSVIRRHKIKHKVEMPMEQDSYRVKWDRMCAWLRWKVRLG